MVSDMPSDPWPVNSSRAIGAPRAFSHRSVLSLVRLRETWRAATVFPSEGTLSRTTFPVEVEKVRVIHGSVNEQVKISAAAGCGAASANIVAKPPNAAASRILFAPGRGVIAAQARSLLG